MVNLYSSTPQQRVVVTGIGTVSSIGIGKEPFWKNLLSGTSGISVVESLDTSSYNRHYAGEIKNFDPTQFMSKRRAKRIGRASQMAIAAGQLAIQDSGFDLKRFPRENTGLFIGTTMGENIFVEQFHDAQQAEREFEKYKFRVFSSDYISANTAAFLKLNGPNKIFATACASGNYAIGRAYDYISTGRSDVCLAGGSDALSRIAYTGFHRLFAMAPEQCQPFDVNRKGMILGEGCCLLILEALEHAQARKANIIAEVLGYGLSCDAYHMTQPKQSGIAKAINKAINRSKVDRQRIGYVCAHGTGTPENDKAESGAIHDVFGEQVKDLAVSSIKSMLGHTMGAASAFEAATCCLAVKEEEIPPTINFTEKDPECDIDCVPNSSRKVKLDVALNNASAFGGNNCCVAFGAV
ncbi:MAG: beta-ketoacyl-[acyl-carrier-protein] synthase family protein [Candidatus Omnitrophica bacterium]|nr:beta-ketoacyl-[acyl-carrier-protein] synthase family protein [Candidatus Omnitrophota bacterium]